MTTWFYCLPWKYILLFMPIVSILYGCFTSISAVKKVQKQICGIVFLIWVGFILYTTLFRREIGEYGTFRWLFQSYAEVKMIPEFYRLNFMNILLFFPAGLALFGALPMEKQGKKFWITAISLMLLSVCIECSQYIFSLGIAEMDDIFHNTLGAVFGAGAAWFAPWAVGKILKR